MKLIYIYIEEEYKNIPKGGYQFDNEFIIDEFTPRGNKTIKLKTNKNYHDPFNSNLNNISCIVGKNGIGKTTFFELIIAPLLWRLDGSILEDKIHLLFYDENEQEFYIETYINNSQGWSLSLNGESKPMYKNIYLQNNRGMDKGQKYGIQNNKFSVMPFQVNIIFHSLSPFDRIYDLLKIQLSDASDEQKSHYHKRLKYIGIRQIENNELTYEYMTLINLINLLIDEKNNKMFKSLGYEFGNINIEVNNETHFHEIKIPNFNSFKKEFRKYIDSLFDEDSYNQLQDKLSEYELKTFKINDLFFRELLLKHISINSVLNFIELLINIEKDLGIKLTKETVEKNILKFIDRTLIENNLSNINFSNKEFLEKVLEKKEDILKLDLLTNKDELKKFIDNGEILDLLKYLKAFSRRDLVKLKINLLKDKKEVDYLKFSSGEKTLLSYFANILGRIKELDEIQSHDATYNNVENKTYLILIDEVELHLHPEWQRNFVKQLNEFFTYENSSKKFQFIIATHSPFVVSDIYDENIIYLGNNNPISKTFGGNIFDIFKDDFYVSNTIGAFSEEVIKELSEMLYILFIIKKANKEKNFFMLREFFDLMYNGTDREKENTQLLEDIDLLFYLGVKSKQFKKVFDNKYLSYMPHKKDEFFKESKLIISNIGEDIVKDHLEKMYLYIKG